jgi:glycosyltransferase involved in cell wall biosynthesis
MILIDALYVNNGGGKILLDYLISNLENFDLNVFYLLDDRIAGKHPEIDSEKYIYLKASLIERHKFYKKNKNSFTKVFCLGNLPPTIRMGNEVFTYFHNSVLLEIPKEFSLVERCKFRLKIAILKNIAKNTDYWIVQSNLMKDRLQSKYHFKSEKIKVLPFYPQFTLLSENFVREENTYLYVSNATPHKNHKILIEVFCDFYDQYKKGKLIVTVNEEVVLFSTVLDLIKEKQELGYPIENLGFVNRLTLQKKYLSSAFLIFPSLTESFGLGLVEAIECGCKVIGADLPYTYEVCMPSLVFDPNDKASIFSVFEKSLNEAELKSSISIIKNEINMIVDLLKE